MDQWPKYAIPWESMGFGHGVPEPDPSPGEDWFTITDAYSDAAQSMLKGIESKATAGVVKLADAPEILPALFLFRHFIELALKTILIEAGKPVEEVVAFGHALKKLLRTCSQVFRKVSDSINRYKEKAPGFFDRVEGWRGGNR